MRFDYEKDTKLKYQSLEYARNYDKRLRTITISNTRSRLVAWHEKKIIRRAISNFPRLPLKLADIPCGTGKLIDILPARNARIVAGDISVEMMALARDYSRLPGFLGLVRMDIVSCPFKDASFDCVITLRLMDRVPEEIRKTMLNELSRISKDYVIISHSLTSFFQHFRSKLRRIFLPDPPYRNLAVPKIKLKEEIGGAGLHIIKISRVLCGLSSEVVLLTGKVKGNTRT